MQPTSSTLPLTLFLAVSALASRAVAVSAWSNATLISYTTSVVDSFTTYCPTPTQFSYGGVAYNVTEPTTVTITNCPCTVSIPVYTSTTSVCDSCSSANATSIPSTRSSPSATMPVFTNATTGSMNSKPLSSSSTALLYSNTSTATVVVTAPPVTSHAASTTVPHSSGTGATTSAPISTFSGASNSITHGAGAGFAVLIAAAAACFL